MSIDSGRSPPCGAPVESMLTPRFWHRLQCCHHIWQQTATLFSVARLLPLFYAQTFVFMRLWLLFFEGKKFPQGEFWFSRPVPLYGSLELDFGGNRLAPPFGLVRAQNTSSSSVSLKRPQSELQMKSF